VFTCSLPNHQSPRIEHRQLQDLITVMVGVFSSSPISSDQRQPTGSRASFNKSSSSVRQI
jgi:hypothetical protein